MSTQKKKLRARSIASTTNTKQNLTVRTGLLIYLAVDENLLFMVNEAGLYDIVQLNDLV